MHVLTTQNYSARLLQNSLLRANSEDQFLGTEEGEKKNVSDVLISEGIILNSFTEDEKQKQIRWFVRNFKQLSSFEKINRTTFLINLEKFKKA